MHSDVSSKKKKKPTILGNKAINQDIISNPTFNWNLQFTKQTLPIQQTFRSWMKIKKLYEKHHLLWRIAVSKAWDTGESETILWSIK